MAIDPQPRPVIELLIDSLPRRFRHQPEGIADQINQRLAIRVVGNVETVAKMTERILAVELQGKRFVSGEVHGHIIPRQTLNPPTAKTTAWQDCALGFCSLRSLNSPYLSPEFMQYEDNPVSIKYYVKRHIQQHPEEFAGKVVIDTPAGSGTTSKALREAGATVHAYDLFPEYFKVDGLTCERANIMEGLPVPDGFADIVFCQEGIEHFSDQYHVFQEFNRVLKKNGSLFMTTPNYSNLQSRLSYFLFETEYYLKTMPPNEIDSIWMADESRTKEIYLGHLFLLGIQKLRLLAKLSGFRIKRFIFTSASSTSLVLLPFAYPLIRLTNWWTYRNNVRRDNQIPGSAHETVYRELMQLNANIRLLVGKHLFVEFEREADLAAVRSNLRGRHATFDVVT
jgi:SAM-dependent methyltransferase